MARYIRDYHVRFLIDGQKTLEYTSIGKERPLHVKFKVAYGETTSKMSLSIFNMSAESRAKLQADDVKVLLQVGFRDTEDPEKVDLKTLFLGTVNAGITTDTKSADHETKITAAEGYELKEIVVQSSFPPLTTHVEVIDALMAQVVTASGNMVTYDSSELNGLGITQVYKKGHSLSGVADKVLKTLLTTHNLKSTVAQGILRIKRAGKSIQTRTYKFDQTSGLLDVPKPLAQKAAQTQSNPLPTKGYKFKVLLTPELVPDAYVELRHPDLGPDPVIVIVEKVSHSGGYESNEWYSTVEGLLPSEGKTENSIADKKTKASDTAYREKLTN